MKENIGKTPEDIHTGNHLFGWEHETQATKEQIQIQLKWLDQTARLYGTKGGFQRGDSWRIQIEDLQMIHLPKD